MINAKEAYGVFKNKYPDLIVLECCLYDNNYYIFTAVKNKNTPEYDDPFYAVHKHTRIVSSFSPMENLEKWLDALANHQVKWR